jgi:choice-of-anchor C domain-containing protein
MPSALLAPLPLLSCQHATSPERPGPGAAVSSAALRADVARRVKPANLIENGGFESPATRTKDYDPFVQGTSIGAWRVEEGAVDLISHHFWKPAKGHQSLDLDGSCGAGTISQHVHPVPGRTYHLRFALAGNPGGPPDVKRLEVWWGDELLGSPSFDVAGTSFRHMEWTPVEYTVTAGSDDVLLRFRSLTPGCYGAALDDVTLEEAEAMAL